MTDKLPTIDIKGKEYVLVKDRILEFHKVFSKGSISTTLLSQPSDKVMVVKAVVIPDISEPVRSFTGHSQAIVGGVGVNATSALENCETSAVGRALAMLGIGILESVASGDEMQKTSKKVQTPQAYTEEPYPCPSCTQQAKLRVTATYKAVICKCNNNKFQFINDPK